MPIYEYKAEDPNSSCPTCICGFEILQFHHEEPLSTCPECGGRVRKMISWCRGAVVESSEEQARVESRIKEYEQAGMWSHAAELADKHSEKIKDKDLRLRALDDYKRAGYDADSLSKHADFDDS